MRSKVVLVLALLSCLLSLGSNGAELPQKEGQLIVRVFVGDDDSQARDAFVYVRGCFGQPSAAITANRPGQFEKSLPPGLYDVFVSEGSSLPMCKRVEIRPDHAKVYTAKLEADEEHLQN